MGRINMALARGHFRHQLRLWAFLLMCIPMILFTFLYTVYEAERSKTEQLQNLQLILRTQQKAIDSWFNERSADVKEISHSRRLKLGMTEGTEERFRLFLDTKKEFFTLLYIDEKGIVQVNTRAPLQESIADRDYFKLNQLGLDAVSELLYGRGVNPGTPIIVFSSPILNENREFLGAIAGTVKIDTISQMMQDYKFGSTGETYLVGHDGTMLTQSRFDEELVKLGVVKKSAKLELKISTDGFKRAMQETTGTAIYVDYRGKKVLGAYQWLENRKLVIIAKIDEQEVMTPFYRRMSFLVIALGFFLALAYKLTNRWAKTIEKPLAELVSGVGTVEQGGYGYQLDTRHFENTPVEFRKLCHLFNRMSETIKDANDKLIEMSILDGLTGIANRRYFDKYLQQEWARCVRTGQPLSLLIVDIDYFKGYNDTYGHLYGDDCLRAVAQALKATARRPADLVARFGGEEFGVILPNTYEAGAARVAEKIINNLELLKLPNAASHVSSYVTVSIGVASVLVTDDLVADQFIQFADTAMYKAKQTGRNRFVVHNSASGQA